MFKFATSVMPAAIEEVLRRANLTIDDVQFIVPHQANLRIIKYAAKRMGLPLERFQVSIAHRGVHPHDAVRRVRKRQHPPRRQGGARRLRRRFHQRGRPVRGVTARSDPLSATGRRGSCETIRQALLVRARITPPLRARTPGTQMTRPTGSRARCRMEKPIKQPNADRPRTMAKREKARIKRAFSLRLGYAISLMRDVPRRR